MSRATSLELDGRLIEAKLSVPKDKMDRRIFVGGLPPDLSPGTQLGPWCLVFGVGLCSLTVCRGWVGQMRYGPTSNNSAKSKKPSFRSSRLRAAPVALVSSRWVCFRCSLIARDLTH